MAHYRVGERLYDMDPTTWPNADVSSVQRALGCGLSKFMERLEEMDVDAVQALIWVLRRRDESGLRIDAVTFTIREYMAAIEVTDDEVRETWPGLTVDERPLFIASLPADQQARLFVDGDLVTEAAPLDPAVTAPTET